MTASDDLALVIQLACLTESRDDDEQRALLRVARKCDDDRNRRRRREFRHELGAATDALPLPDPSNLEHLAHGSRVLEPDDGEKVVRLKARKRRPWADPDPGPPGGQP